MDDVTALTAESELLLGSSVVRSRFLSDVTMGEPRPGTLQWLASELARIEAAAARRAIEGSGVVRTVQAKRPPSGVDSHMAGWVRWDKPMDPITHLLANLDYESYEVDAVGGGKVRCWKFSEWPDTLRRAVETVRAALSRPEEPRVERCTWCGTPIAEHPLTDACAIAQESEVR